MPALPGVPRFSDLALRWLELSERRLSHHSELYRSGRWRRYYTSQEFADRVTDVLRAVRFWRRLCGVPPVKASDDDWRAAA